MKKHVQISVMRWCLASGRGTHVLYSWPQAYTKRYFSLFTEQSAIISLTVMANGAYHTHFIGSGVLVACGAVWASVYFLACELVYPSGCLIGGLYLCWFACCCAAVFFEISLMFGASGSFGYTNHVSVDTWYGCWERRPKRDHRKDKAWQQCYIMLSARPFILDTYTFAPLNLPLSSLYLPLQRCSFIKLKFQVCLSSSTNNSSLSSLCVQCVGRLNWYQVFGMCSPRPLILQYWKV